MSRTRAVISDLRWMLVVATHRQSHPNIVAKWDLAQRLAIVLSRLCFLLSLTGSGSIVLAVAVVGGPVVVVVLAAWVAVAVVVVG